MKRRKQAGHDSRRADLPQQIDQGYANILVFVIHARQQPGQVAFRFHPQIEEGFHGHLTDVGALIFESLRQLRQIFFHAVAAQSIDGHETLHIVVIMEAFLEAGIQTRAVQVDAGFQSHFLDIDKVMIQLAEDHVFRFGAAVLIAEEDNGAFQHFGIFAARDDIQEELRIIQRTQLRNLRNGSPLELFAQLPEDRLDFFHGTMIVHELAGFHGNHDLLLVMAAQRILDNGIVADGGKSPDDGLIEFGVLFRIKTGGQHHDGLGCLFMLHEADALQGGHQDIFIIIGQRIKQIDAQALLHLGGQQRQGLPPENLDNGLDRFVPQGHADIFQGLEEQGDGFDVPHAAQSVDDGRTDQGRGRGQRLHQSCDRAVVIDFRQGFDNGKLHPFFIVHGLAQTVYRFGIAQIAETDGSLIAHVDFRVLQQRLAQQLPGFAGTAVPQNIGDEDADIRIGIMQAGPHGLHVVVADFAENIHGHIADGGVVAAQQGQNRINAFGAANTPQGIFRAFLHAEVFIGKLLAQDGDGFFDGHIACGKGCAANPLIVGRVQILENLMRVVASVLHVFSAPLVILSLRR